MNPKTIVLVIAHDGYQPIEYGVTREILASNKNVKILTASDKSGVATATDSSSTTIDLTIPEIQPTQIDALFLIGGAGALTWLDTPELHALLQQMMTLNKPYGSICISSRILAQAGVLGGKKATGWDGDDKLEGIFKTHAVTYIKEPVVVDGSIVTAVGPKAAERFAQKILHVLDIA